MILMSDSLKDRLDTEETHNSAEPDVIFCSLSTKNKSIICNFVEAKVFRDGSIAELTVEVSPEAAAYILCNSPITSVILNSNQNKNYLLACRENGYDVVIKQNELLYIVIISS